MVPPKDRRSELEEAGNFFSPVLSVVWPHPHLEFSFGFPKLDEKIFPPF